MCLLLTTIIAALLLAAPAGARVKPGLYVGKTDAGKPVKLRVKGTRVTASAKLGVPVAMVGTWRQRRYGNVGVHL